ncbi:hypothetical protein SH2C18_36890 [Clostridium sediminicola]
MKDVKKCYQKKLLALVLTTTILLSFTACDSSSNKLSTNNTLATNITADTEKSTNTNKIVLSYNSLST